MQSGITPIGRTYFYTILIATAIVGALAGFLISRIDPGTWRTGLKTGIIVFVLLFIGLWIIAQQRVEDRIKGNANATPSDGRHQP